MKLSSAFALLFLFRVGRAIEINAHFGDIGNLSDTVDHLGDSFSRVGGVASGSGLSEYGLAVNLGLAGNELDHSFTFPSGGNEEATAFERLLQSSANGGIFGSNRQSGISNNYNFSSVLPTSAKDNVKMVVLTKEVPIPYNVEVEKKVPYYVRIPVEKPYPVYVPKPLPVTVPKPVQYPVYVPKSFPIEVEKRIPVPLKIMVERPIPYHVPKPYPVVKEKVVPHFFEAPIPYPVKVQIENRYPVHIPFEKKVPYPVEKRIPVPVKIPHIRDVPVHVVKPVPIHYDKPIPYPVFKKVPYPVKIPVQTPFQVPVPYPVSKLEPFFDLKPDFGVNLSNSKDFNFTNNLDLSDFFSAINSNYEVTEAPHIPPPLDIPKGEQLDKLLKDNSLLLHDIHKA